MTTGFSIIIGLFFFNEQQFLSKRAVNVMVCCAAAIPIGIIVMMEQNEGKSASDPLHHSSGLPVSARGSVMARLHLIGAFRTNVKFRHGELRHV